MGEALTIEVRHEQGCAIVTAAGEIDISTVTPLRERLFEMAASGAPLVVDLEQVSFIDSVGLATLVGAAKRAAAHGGSLQVACALPKIRQLGGNYRAGPPDTAVPHPGRGRCSGRLLDEPAFPSLTVGAVQAPLPAEGLPYRRLVAALTPVRSHSAGFFSGLPD